MDIIKTVWNKISKPKTIWIVLFYIFFAILASGTIILVILEPNQSILHYFLYALSAISLSYFVYTCVYLAPKIKHSIIKALKKYKFTNTMLHDYGYRTIIFSIFSFILNLLYVIFLGTFAIISKSVWYISITSYYLILSFSKINIFYAKKKYGDDISQAKTMRATGILFIFLTIALSGIIVLVYTSNMYFEYAGLMIYIVASYTFYKLTLSIINYFKAKHHQDLYVTNIRNINLVSALVSIMVLQVAMFQAFAPVNNTSIANGLTGGGISIIILILGIFMIIKANKLLHSTKEENNEK